MLFGDWNLKNERQTSVKTLKQWAQVRWQIVTVAMEAEKSGQIGNKNLRTQPSISTLVAPRASDPKALIRPLFLSWTFTPLIHCPCLLLLPSAHQAKAGVTASIWVAKRIWDVCQFPSSPLLVRQFLGRCVICGITYTALSPSSENSSFLIFLIGNQIG